MLYTECHPDLQKLWDDEVDQEETTDVITGAAIPPLPAELRSIFIMSLE